MVGTAHLQTSAKLITDFIEGRVHCNNNIKPKEIINNYQTEFETNITYKKAHIAREFTLRKVQGSYEELFHILPLYFIELQRASPGARPRPE